MFRRFIRSAQRQKFGRLLFATIEPNENFFYYWTAVVLLAFVYNLIVCPIMIFEEFAQTYYSNWLMLNLLADLVNICDLLIQSKRVFYKSGVLITEPFEAFKHYAKKRIFVLDALAVIPTDIFLFLWSEMSLFRFNRLLKLHRVRDFIKRTEIHTTFPNLFRLIRLIFACFSLFHYNACFYYLFSIVYGSPTDSLDDWVFAPVKIPNLRYSTCDARYNVGTCTMDERRRDFWHRDKYVDELIDFHSNRFEETQFGNLTKKYGLSFYWSALTLTTLGEQPWPNNSIEMCFEICNTLFGLLLFAIILGDIGSMVTHMNFARTSFEEFRDGCKTYMKFRDVNSFTKTRILAYLDFNWFQGDSTVDEREIAKTLPTRLHAQLVSAVHLSTLKKVALFKDCDLEILHELIKRLRVRIFSPGDFICYRGDIGKEMYVVKSGRLQVLNDKQNEVIALLEEGAVFGELSILDIPGNKNKNRRSASIKSIGYSTLYSLTKDDLWHAISDYPSQHQNLIEKGKEILRKDKLLDNESDYYFAIDEPNIHLTIEDRLLKISQSMQQLNDLTEQFEHCYHSSSNELKRRLAKAERKFIKLINQGKLKRPELKKRVSKLLI